VAQTTYLVERAADYYKQGETHGDNAALLVAIAVYGEVLEEWTREGVSRDLAATQNG
jgi:hypothetical protein